MSFDRDTENITRALEDMQGRSRSLNDSLKLLAEEGFERLSRAAQTQARGAAGGRSSGGDSAAGIAAQELSRVLKAELAEVLKQSLLPQAARGDAGGINVIVHNNTAARVGVRESTDAFDRRTLEITIDQMVAQSLAQGRQTGSVLQSLFGLVPSLVGR